jgi:hypothetical protein
MKLKAYILAADPNWIEESVLSYYGIVQEIIVSFDGNGIGWSGKPIPVKECLRRLRAIDRDHKMKFMEGNYSLPSLTPMQNDTHQRQSAIDAIGNTADWILELDTDEILPKGSRFLSHLACVPDDITVVEWPMRVFFQKLPSGRFLEVTDYLGRQCSEYPGPIATRPGVKLDSARVIQNARKWRFDISAVNRDPLSGALYRPDAVIPREEAILHFSWIRSDVDIRSKINGWGHSEDFKTVDYYGKCWSKAPWKWPFIFNFHPLTPKRWPALRPTNIHLRDFDHS